ncbi:gamma-glutamyl-gamma-aminobutyrate hydrolase family protein [Sphingomonas sp. RRHST34]|uniref:Gamma-glutamyl-gamma-aminobutyrate hydrolase family protein n=1 Tax=Sphingomonas citri TaxID=2862499 RepID=A0ABS7BNU9_9SPHN|nr:gamma-glutamyl-gamma-aminobutyrate hydrolase family protein [Sphingomonas citri]MBW6531231.1 gamma-glutamyl-gamma-aminobutyrate hydrolase family protein [Sphingomonas citri]
MASRRPLIGVLCCNEVAHRPVQAVASRFVRPLAAVSGATVLLVPALTGANEAAALAAPLDGLLLTGSRSHVAPERYGGTLDLPPEALDPERDEVALSLADAMIAAGKPEFGICRGLQEINVLFGGSLSADSCCGRHLRGGSWAQRDYAELFTLRHDVQLAPEGRLARATGERQLTVHSVHEQAIERLGGGLRVEARSSDDGVIEAVAAPGCGAEVLAVQWHPEWDVDSSAGSQAFFALIGAALRGEGERAN